MKRKKTDVFLRASAIIEARECGLSCIALWRAHRCQEGILFDDIDCFYCAYLLGPGNVGFPFHATPVKKARECRLMLLALAHTLWHDPDFDL